MEIALIELVRRSRGRTVDPGVALSIERFDDVVFESDGDAMDILRTKHSVEGSRPLTDSSVDVWRTLKVWIDLASKGDSSARRASGAPRKPLGSIPTGGPAAPT